MGKTFGLILALITALLFSLPVELIAICGLVGLLLGHFWFDSKSSPAVRVSTKVHEERLPSKVDSNPELVANALCPLFIELARCDGSVSQTEIRVIREFFQVQLRFNEVSVEHVRLALKAAISSAPQDVSFLARQARSQLPPTMRLEFVQALYDLAQADGQISKPETDLMKQIVAQLNLSDEGLQSITAQFFGSADLHYRALQLTNEATDDEVKSAYRKLAVEFHPDKFATRSPQEIETAALKFRSAKEAFEAIKKIRGI